MTKTIHCHWENRFVLQWHGAVRKFYHDAVYVIFQQSLSVLELIKLREIWDYFHYQNKVILLYLLVQKFKLKSFHLN